MYNREFYTQNGNEWWEPVAEDLRQEKIENGVKFERVRQYKITGPMAFEFGEWGEWKQMISPEFGEIPF